MNYWNDLDKDLESLMSNGYCYLPSVKNIIDLDKIARDILQDISSNIYSSNIPAHTSFCNDFGITEVLAPKLFDLAKNEFNYNGSINDQYHIARKVDPGLNSEAYRGHFDSHCFTLVMPIKIPQKNTDESVGDLVFSPNARKMPGNEFVNFFQKAYFKKYASKDGFSKLSKSSNVLTEDFANYKPLLFVGMRTFHGNKPVNQVVNSERITLLSHFFDPSPPWGIGNILRILRNR